MEGARTLGLALGGGGVAGCSHVGVICALEEEGIRIDCLAGTSAGSMVAALYANGYSGRALADILPGITQRMLDYDYWGLLRHMLLMRGKPLEGLIRGKRLHSFLKDMLGDRRLQDMKLPLAITATDLRSAKQVLFASEPICLPSHSVGGIEVVSDTVTAEAVMASMAIPGLFRPVRLGERVLVDGGLMDNCPTAALACMGVRKIIAVNLVSVRPLRSGDQSVGANLQRAMYVGLDRLSHENDRCADLVLNPDVGSIGILDFSSVSLCLERGYTYTRNRMGDILRLLEEEGEGEGGRGHMAGECVAVPPGSTQPNAPASLH